MRAHTQIAIYSRFSLERLLEVMDDRDRWKERAQEILAGSVT